MANLTRARQKTPAAASLLLLFILLSALPPSNAWGGATSTASAARSLLRPSKVAALNGRCPPRPRFPSRGAGQTLRGKCASCPRTCLSSSRSSSCSSSSSSPPPASETALFSCGCFWKPQQLFDATPGVLGTAVGYCRASSATGSGVAGSGGAGDRRQSLSSAAAAAAAAASEPPTPPPTYESVCGGNGFTETVMVEFDPNSVTYARLLEVFWDSHDASVLLPKPQYQSALWPLSPAQHQEAQRQIRALSSKAPSKASPEEEQLQQRPQQAQLQQLQQLQPVEQQEGLATGRRPSGSPATVLFDLRHHHQDHQGHLGANDQGGQSTPLASPCAEFAAAAAANASAAVPDRAAAAAAQAPMSSLTSAEFWRAEGYHQDFWPKMRLRAAALALLVVVQYAAFPVASSLVNLPGDATHMSMGGGEGASIPQFSSFLFSSSSHILYSRAKAVVEWSTALQVVVALELAYQRLVGPQLSRLRRRTDHTAALSFGGPQRRGHEKKKNLPSQQVG